METWVVALLVCGIYLLVTLLMGILPALKVSHSVTGYVAADRSMNTLMLYFVLGASIFSSFAFLGGPGWAYSRGAAAFYIIGYGIVGILPMYFVGPRTRRMGIRFGFVTQAEMLAHRFGTKWLSVVLGVLSVAVFLPYLTLQMEGAGLILEVITEGRVPAWVGALVTYSVVLIYVLFSGVLGVGWTNTFQGIFMMAIAWFLGIYLPYKLFGGVGAMFEAVEASEHVAKLTAPGLDGAGHPWTWGGFTSAILVSAVGFSMWPHFFMKNFAAKSDRAIRRTVLFYPTFQVFLIPILIVGFTGILAFPGITPADRILPTIIMQTGLSPLLVGLVCAGTLAASMSSGDAILHAAASIGIRDSVRPLVPLDDKRERSLIRVLAVVLAGVAYYFAVASDFSLVQLLLAAYGGVAQIFPLVFAMFYWPRATRAGALAGLIGGIAVNTLFLLAPELKPFPLHEGVYGLAANVLLLIGISLLTTPEDEEKVMAYVEG